MHIPMIISQQCFFIADIMTDSDIICHLMDHINSAVT